VARVDEQLPAESFPEINSGTDEFTVLREGITGLGISGGMESVGNGESGP